MKRIAQVSLSGQLAGYLEEEDGTTSFAYTSEWLARPDAQPVSLTLPLQSEPYTQSGLHPFFENLLPEGWLFDVASRKLKISNVDSIQERFAKAIFRLHQTYNLLDLNLGLSIRFLENPADVARSHDWLSTSSVSTKIDRFVQLVPPECPEADEVASWRERAHKARRDRNRYTHAFYHIPPGAPETRPAIQVPPWMSAKLGIATESSMSIDEFEAIVGNIESVFEEFQALRKKTTGI